MTYAQLAGYAIGFAAPLAVAAIIVLVHRVIVCLGLLNQWLRLRIEREQRLARLPRQQPDHLERIRVQAEVDQLVADIQAERERLAGPR